MTLERLSEWVRENYPPDRYFTPDDLIQDVEQRFNADGHDMNDNIRQLLIDEFTKEFSPEYRAYKQRQEEKQQIADFIGSGEVFESTTDEIVDQLRSPQAEILDIDMSEYSTQKESVIPPDIIKFQRSRQGPISRFGSFFRRIFGRK